jgi:CO/xanthine dehydrogenase Mo-binding subunit
MAEYLVIRDGRFAPGDSVQYDMLPPSEMPPVEIYFLDSTEAPRGVGTLAQLLFPPAFTSALHQIIRKGATSLPVRPEDIYTLVTRKEEAE